MHGENVARSAHCCRHQCRVVESCRNIPGVASGVRVASVRRCSKLAALRGERGAGGYMRALPAGNAGLHCHGGNLALRMPAGLEAGHPSR